MHDFSYHRPQSLADASSAFARSAEARYLAGGQTLIPTLKQRLVSPADLIDLGAVPGLKDIDVAAGGVTIGALVTHAEVATDAGVRAAIPALSYLASRIGDPQVRHRGTLGGAVANADPSADYPSGVLALDAEVRTDRRTIPADQMFKGMFETALDDGEIITAIRFKVPVKAAYRKFPSPASRYAMVGVFIAKFADAVRVAVTGAGPNAFRVTAMEKALSADFSAKAIAGLKVPEGGLTSDLHGSAEYRAELITVMARRAVESIA